VGWPTRSSTWSAPAAPAANNLVEVEEIVQISSRLVVNQAALKLKRERLAPILDAFERASAALA
jgi:ATP phosphoribosyltransferase